MIIRSELRSASARESTFFVSHPKNVSAECELISFTPARQKQKQKKQKNAIKQLTRNSPHTNTNNTHRVASVTRERIKRERSSSGSVGRNNNCARTALNCIQNFVK
jgi:hypothetical protein